MFNTQKPSTYASQSLMLPIFLEENERIDFSYLYHLERSGYIIENYLSCKDIPSWEYVLVNSIKTKTLSKRLSKPDFVLNISIYKDGRILSLYIHEKLRCIKCKIQVDTSPNSHGIQEDIFALVEEYRKHLSQEVTEFLHINQLTAKKDQNLLTALSDTPELPLFTGWAYNNLPIMLDNDDRVFNIDRFKKITTARVNRFNCDNLQNWTMCQFKEISLQKSILRLEASHKRYGDIYLDIHYMQKKYCVTLIYNPKVYKAVHSNHSRHYEISKEICELLSTNKIVIPLDEYYEEVSYVHTTMETINLSPKPPIWQNIDPSPLLNLPDYKGCGKISFTYNVPRWQFCRVEKESTAKCVILQVSLIDRNSTIYITLHLKNPTLITYTYDSTVYSTVPASLLQSLHVFLESNKCMQQKNVSSNEDEVDYHDYSIISEQDMQKKSKLFNVETQPTIQTQTLSPPAEDHSLTCGQSLEDPMKDEVMPNAVR